MEFIVFKKKTKMAIGIYASSDQRFEQIASLVAFRGFAFGLINVQMANVCM